MATRRSAVKETEVAACVVRMLKAGGWTVYQEVQTSGGAADIVGVNGDRTCIVEVKNSLSLDLIGQAWQWMRWGAASFVSVAHLATRQHWSRPALQELGIGQIIVRSIGDGRTDLFDVYQGRELKVEKHFDIRKWLHEDQLDGLPAGSNGGGRSTPFSRTVRDLTKWVAEYPGATLREASEAVPSHYPTKASFRANIRAVSKRGLTPGIRFELGEDGKTWRLYPSEASDG